MAQLSAGQVESVQLYSGVESQVIEMQNSAHASATTWYKGDLVVIGTTADAGLVEAQASYGSLTGIALEDASATTYTKLDIALLDPAAIYVMRVLYAYRSAREFIGEKHPITYSTGYQRIDTSTAASSDVYIVGIYPGDEGAGGSTGLLEGRVLVRFVYTVFTGI